MFSCSRCKARLWEPCKCHPGHSLLKTVVLAGGIGLNVMMPGVYELASMDPYPLGRWVISIEQPGRAPFPDDGHGDAPRIPVLPTVTATVSGSNGVIRIRVELK